MFRLDFVVNVEHYHKCQNANLSGFSSKKWTEMKKSDIEAWKTNKDRPKKNIKADRLNGHQKYIETINKRDRQIKRHSDTQKDTY